MLKDWSMENLRDAVISAMGSKNGTAYGSVSEANKDIWSVDNADRVLFGALKSNYNVDHSVALATIDTTADKFDAAALTLMKRIALTADPKIRPIRTTEDERWYIVYANSLSFRDLKADSVITAAQREAMARGKNNPLFAGGDIVYDGCIVKEIEDIPSVGAVGGSSSTVGSVYLCGAQAIGLAWAKRTTSKTEEFDYGDKHGVAIEEIRAVEKLTFGSGSSDTADLKDHGMVTGYFSATADA
jgi:hypothetical protein